MSQISRDNCCTCMSHRGTCSEFPETTIRFEGYGFTLDYEGSDDEYLEEFESMLSMFYINVVKSYRELKNFNLDSRYESCFDFMVEDFETHTCPFGILDTTQPHF